MTKIPDATAAVKPPSKSECQRMLRAAFGPRTRFARMGDGLAVVAYTEDGDEYHLAEITPKVNGQGERGLDELLPWYATLAAFRAHGFRIERGPHGWEVRDADEPKARPRVSLPTRVRAWFVATFARLFHSLPS